MPSAAPIVSDSCSVSARLLCRVSAGCDPPSVLLERKRSALIADICCPVCHKKQERGGHTRSLSFSLFFLSVLVVFCVVVLAVARFFVVLFLFSLLFSFGFRAVVLCALSAASSPTRSHQQQEPQHKTVKRRRTTENTRKTQTMEAGKTDGAM